jgi:hypothetical protein
MICGVNLRTAAAYKRFFNDDDDDCGTPPCIIFATQRCPAPRRDRKHTKGLYSKLAVTSMHKCVSTYIHAIRGVG